jgi:hypothetical protein
MVLIHSEQKAGDWRACPLVAVNQHCEADLARKREAQRSNTLHIASMISMRHRKHNVGLARGWNKPRRPHELRLTR